MMADPLARLRKASEQKGVKVPISLAALNAGLMVQYDRDHASLKFARRVYGRFNKLYVQNNSDENIAIDLDFTTSKRYIVIARTGKEITDIDFQEFNVTNISATNTSADEVVITCIFERPLAREG
jgi:hypothetical protein